jgi:hypothetical protein
MVVGAGSVLIQARLFRRKAAPMFCAKQEPAVAIRTPSGNAVFGAHISEISSGFLWAIADRQNASAPRCSYGFKE